MYATSMSRNQEEPLFNRVEDARTLLGISRNELAEAVGVHYQTIGYIERGEYNPSLSLALRLAETLKVEVSEIFSSKPFRKVTR
jgi:DNA-binding XRE family transcriptional regulator